MATITNVVAPSNLGSEFLLGTDVANKITVAKASDLVAGKVALAIAANYPQATNDTDAATPAFVKAAIDAAVAAIPADKFLSSAVVAGTILTLTLSDASTVSVNLQDLIPVQVASSTSVSVTGNGTSATPVTASVIFDPAIGNLAKNTGAGVLVDSKDITALATVDVQDAFGNHLYYAFA